MMPIHLTNLGLLLMIRYNLKDKIYHLRQVPNSRLIMRATLANFYLKSSYFFHN